MVVYTTQQIKDIDRKRKARSRAPRQIRTMVKSIGRILSDGTTPEIDKALAELAAAIRTQSVQSKPKPKKQAKPKKSPHTWFSDVSGSTYRPCQSYSQQDALRKKYESAATFRDLEYGKRCNDDIVCKAAVVSNLRSPFSEEFKFIVVNPTTGKYNRISARRSRKTTGSVSRGDIRAVSPWSVWTFSNGKWYWRIDAKGRNATDWPINFPDKYDGLPCNITALRRVVRANHPDKNTDGNIELYQLAVEKINIIRMEYY